MLQRIKIAQFTLSNDSSGLLEYIYSDSNNRDYKKYNLIGFDPALNLSNKKEKFLRIKNYFSSSNLLKAKVYQKAKLITSIAMFYDLDNPNDSSCLTI